MQTQHITEQLQEIGLSSDQARVYLYLIENGSIPANALSRRLGITRTLVYKILDDLDTKGLVEKDDSYKVTRFSANHPHALRSIAESERQAADEVARKVETVIGPLLSAYNLESNKPAVHFMEGLAGVQEILKDSLTASEPIYMYVDSDTIEQEVLDLDAAYVPKRLKKGIVKKMLMVRSPIAETYSKENQTDLTQVRLMSSETTKHFHAFCYIYDKKVIYGTYKEGTFTSTIIYDESIYTMQRLAFEALWQCSPNN